MLLEENTEGYILFGACVSFNRSTNLDCTSVHCETVSLAHGDVALMVHPQIYF